MSFRTILVPIEQHDLMSSTLETALRLAQKFDSYIEGFASLAHARYWPRCMITFVANVSAG